MSQSATLTAPSGSADSINDQLDYLNQFVSFSVDGQLLGVPVNSVQEVLNPQSITRTPKAKPEIAGLLNLRGQIVTAIDLRKRLKLPALEGDRQSMNVVVRFNDESYSLLVDEVGEVINVSGETLQPPPRNLDAHWKPITSGVYRLQHRLIVIINVTNLLNF
ncbi:chemotaxis protein CheW [Symmachiella dynata]|mgnify:CR=1 FL=1|jgi:purine-binding chemotaxis protein CheW|uniref:Chemotaxis protein CheW n=1 Tax=Symmachiella dynata TaxID=2527995 RepID=A0A517ZTG1_9PLAN|nr:chemotaxis protein CheW [Symmachiella dynata]QDT50050.1 Chemotaxis protein CheW [Symmachiella dynata]QDU45777.1 Chemotaxis protein CheW [Symmachiella dynata]